MTDETIVAHPFTSAQIYAENSKAFTQALLAIRASQYPRREQTELIVLLTKRLDVMGPHQVERVTRTYQRVAAFFARRAAQ